MDDVQKVSQVTTTTGNNSFQTKGVPEDQDLRMLQPAVDHYLRVTRQIDRFIQLELRLSEPVHGHLKGE